MNPIELPSQVQAALEVVGAEASRGSGSIADDRLFFRWLARMAGPPELVAEVFDRSFTGPAGDILIRVYRPNSAGQSPTVVFFPWWLVLYGRSR